jgi:hypothetical protein
MNLCADHNHHHYIGLSHPFLCYTNTSVCVFTYVSVPSAIDIFSKLFVPAVFKIVQRRVSLSVHTINRLITLSNRIVHSSITEVPVHAMVSKTEHTEFVQSGSLTQTRQ